MTVFNADYADRYDSLYASKDYGAECDLIEAAFAANGASPSTILDIGCGTGSHVIELAKRGYQCSGVDQSAAMLDIARNKASTIDLKFQPDWYCGNAVDFQTDQQYDAAIMMFAVASYLTTNEMISASLANIAQHVKPGGIFICDFWYGPAVLSVRPEDRVRLIENGDSRVLRAAKTTVDSFHQTADVFFQLWTIDGQKLAKETKETHKMRYFFAQEFRMLLHNAGFEPLTISEFPHLQKLPTDQSWNALSIARKI